MRFSFSFLIAVVRQYAEKQRETRSNWGKKATGQSFDRVISDNDINVFDMLIQFQTEPDSAHNAFTISLITSRALIIYVSRYR